MYTPPKSFDALVTALTGAAGSKQNARLLVYVELTLRLAQQLGLDSEPLTVGWVLLSRMPLHHELLNRLSPEQRKMSANAAIIVPLSSCYAWESALTRYANLPSQLRLYAVQPLRLDDQAINLARQEPCPEPAREVRYDEILSADLPYEQRVRRDVELDETYHFRAKTLPKGEMRSGQVTIEAAMRVNTKDAPWFDAHRPRTVISFHVSIQRYISERDRTGNEQRATSVLVGCNHNSFSRRWEADTTLICLPVERNHGKTGWESGVGKLLDKVGMRKLELPEEVLAAPERYGSYGHEVDGDEYYVVYAEGRKFGEERGRSHKVKTGVSLRERSQIIEGVLSLLGGWLEVSPLLRKDVQAPTNVLALRDYRFMFPQNKSAPKKWASWREMLKTSLTNGGHEQLHLVVLYRSPEFCQRAKAQIDETLMGADRGDVPLVTVSYEPLPPLLYAPLEASEEDVNTQLLKQWQKPAGFAEKWATQMRASYGKKRDEWRGFLRGLDWQPNARRLVLIDSNGESEVRTRDQRIKGAVRDASHREHVLSQFIIGHTLKPDTRVGHEGKLKGESAGRLKNAVLDLVVRQQGILYAPPCDIYRKAAGLDASTAGQLDVIAFCRVEGSKPSRYRYVLAVRLRASGEVDVLLPNDQTQWLSYESAAHKFAMILSNQRVPLANEDAAPSRINHGQMLDFVHEVLTKRLERPTLAVIEAAGWRNGRGADEEKHCWTQLRNGDLSKVNDRLHFDGQRSYHRHAPALDNLLGVVRLRVNDETPQYVTAADWSAEDVMRDVPHLTGYVDPSPTELFTYMSVARLPEMQKKQNAKVVTEAFRGDVRCKPKYEDIAVKHAQLIEMVPFFVHPHFQSEDGLRILSRCVHFLRVSPAFTMGDIALPYPMHLGETLIEDQLVIIGAED